MSDSGSSRIWIIDSQEQFPDLPVRSPLFDRGGRFERSQNSEIVGESLGERGLRILNDSPLFQNLTNTVEVYIEK